MRLPEPSHPPSSDPPPHASTGSPATASARQVPSTAPPHCETRPRPRQASQRRDIFLPAILEPRSFPSSKNPRPNRLPPPIKGVGRSPGRRTSPLRPPSSLA
jgi:hypothetical protein